MSILSELLKKKNWRIWLKGLLSAAISGGGVGIVSAFTAPQDYSFKHLVLPVLTAAVAGMGLYLRKSPIPELEEL